MKKKEISAERVGESFLIHVIPDSRVVQRDSRALLTLPPLPLPTTARSRMNLNNSPKFPIVSRLALSRLCLQGAKEASHLAREFFVARE